VGPLIHSRPATGPEDKAICAAIIAMGKSLNLTVVAEGVETLDQQTFPQDNNCDQNAGSFSANPFRAINSPRCCASASSRQNNR